MQEQSFLDFVSSHLWSLKYAFFFWSSCRCTLVFLLDGYRSAQTPVATVSSGPRWGRYARECSLLHSVQSSVATWVEPCESSWRRGVGGGAFKDGSTVSAICCEMQTRKTSSQLVLAQDRMAPAQRRRRHDAGQRHRSQMLSGGVRWHANSISIIAVISLFALSGPNQGQPAAWRAGARRAGFRWTMKVHVPLSSPWEKLWN